MRLYFSTDREFVPPFHESEQGIHFVFSLQAAQEIFEELRDKKYIYSIEVADEDINPVLIDDDILFWSGPNIAELLLCKLDNKNYEGAFVGQEDIKPSKTIINVFEEDRPSLQIIAHQEASFNSFSDILKLLRKKKYTAIAYKLWEGNRKYKALIINSDYNFNYNTLQKEN